MQNMFDFERDAPGEPTVGYVIPSDVVSRFPRLNNACAGWLSRWYHLPAGRRFPRTGPWSCGTERTKDEREQRVKSKARVLDWKNMFARLLVGYPRLMKGMVLAGVCTLIARNGGRG